MSELGERLVDAVTTLAGRHAGYRALHAKGTGATGTFVGAPEARELTRASLFAGDPVAATIRFSNGNGDPHRADALPDGRGMAVKLQGPDGPLDLVALSLPVFFVRTVDAFLAFTAARTPDPDTGELDPERLGLFVAEHPEALPALEASLVARPPAAYTSTTYHGIHALRWLDARGQARFARYHWRPADGEHVLTDDEAAALGPDYLRDRLAERLASGPAVFTLHAQVAGWDDDPTDPTVAWPDDRSVLLLGTLAIEAATGDGSDALVFDPTRLVDGIELSNDEILRARAEAYAVSYARRSG